MTTNLPVTTQDVQGADIAVVEVQNDLHADDTPVVTIANLPVTTQDVQGADIAVVEVRNDLHADDTPVVTIAVIIQEVAA
jgi:predicted N-formylglutamate amidohydrolase